MLFDKINHSPRKILISLGQLYSGNKSSYLFHLPQKIYNVKNSSRKQEIQSTIKMLFPELNNLD